MPNYPHPDRDKETLCIVVDWGRYDNNAIRDGFKKLAADIIKSRPKGIKPQVRKEAGRGRMSEWRAKLVELGLTRLSARYQARQLLQEMRQAYDHIAASLSDDGPTAVQKKLDATRRRFEASFHKILRFKKSSPLCLAQSRFAK